MKSFLNFDEFWQDWLALAIAHQDYASKYPKDCASILLASDFKNLLASNSKNLVTSKATSEYWSIGSMLHSIKSYSAKQIPKVMNHIGKVWQDGRYDEMIRDEREFQIKWEYIRQNPYNCLILPVSPNSPT